MSWGELIAMISLATDVGMVQPLESGLATCVVATALADQIDTDGGTRDRVARLALLQHIGCTSGASAMAELVGDEVVMREHAGTVDFGNKREMGRFMFGHIARVNPPLSRPGATLRLLAGNGRMNEVSRDTCEAGAMLAARCGYDQAHLSDLELIFEYWNGNGFPNGLSGDAIPLPVRIVHVATQAVNASRELSVAEVCDLIAARGGKTFDPSVAAAFVSNAEPLLEPVTSSASLWDDALAALGETTAGDIDAALSAVADFIDLKSPYLVGHSRGVAELAAAAAAQCGLTDSEQTLLRHAGYVHDVGRLSVSSAVWNRAGALRPDEWEKVRLHPYYTGRVLDRVPFLRDISTVASAHHERLDGSGYSRGATAASLDRLARILAAADSFHAMQEPRPHRAALSAEQATTTLLAQVSDGTLDGAAVDAVLAASGAPRKRSSKTADGLTARETEILSHVARGLSMREIARTLSISPKTVDGHLQRIYPKIGVGTRAGATLYAIQNGLVSPSLGENSP